MADTPTLPKQLRKLAPKPAPGPNPSPSSAQSNIPSPVPIFDDCAAVTPVTMGDQPYRTLSQRWDNPSRDLTIEQLVDTRLSVSSLTPQMCRQIMCQLDDQQIKNAVYDRALCFPFAQWTQNIRLSYGRQVQHDNQVVASFANMTNHMDNMLETWRHVYFFKDGDFNNLETHVKGYISPSIDNIGVYGTFSGHIETKINALSALLKVGNIMVQIPILTSQRGLVLFEYDPLSRAVANILSTTTTDADRREIFSLEMEGEFLELSKRAAAVGLFPGLLKALTSGAGAVPYNIPRGEQLMPDTNKRVPTEQVAPPAKRSRGSQDGQYMGQAAIDREGAPTPGSSRESSRQPRALTEGYGASPIGQRNPFSRPASAGSLAMPFAKKFANSTPASTIKIEDERNELEQIDPSLLAQSQGAELQGIAKGATERQPESQGVQEVIEVAPTQNEQAEGMMEAQQPPAEGQQEQGAQQQPQPTGQSNAANAIKPAYDEMLQRIENEVFHSHASESPEEQLQRAPAIAALIEGSAGSILKKFRKAADECEEMGLHEDFNCSLNNTAFALLWILESCALNVGGTPLSSEVSRRVSRDALVGALWGTVRVANPVKWLDLLNVKDNQRTETFGEKLERIIWQMKDTGIAGYDSLRLILDNMRSGVVWAENPLPDPSTTFVGPEGRPENSL